MIGEQLEVEADLPHVLGLVHDQRASPADEGAQPGQRLAFEIVPNVDVLAGDEQGIGVVPPHVLADQRGLADPPGAVHDNDPAGRDRALEPFELGVRDVPCGHHTD